MNSRPVAVCLAAIGFFAFVAPASLAQTANHPPVEAFGQLPNIGQPQLSPDGKYLAMLQYMKGRPVLCVYTVGAPPGTLPAIAQSGDWLIGRVMWAKKDRLIVYLTKDAKLGFNYEHAGRLEDWGRAISMDVTGGDGQLLFRHNMSFATNISLANVADVDLDDPDNVFIPYYASDANDQYRYDMFRVDVRTGDDHEVVGGDTDTRDWFMDGHGKVVARVDRADKSLEGHVKVFEKGDWRDLFEFDASEGRGSGVLGLSDDGAALIWVGWHSGEDTDSFVRLDIATGNETLLFKRPNIDLDDAIVDEWSGRIVGVHYIDDRDEYEYFDPQRESLQRGIETAFPGNTAFAASMDSARDLVVVGVESPRTPTTYYMLDRQSHQASLIGKTYPHLNEADLGDMKPYPYKARDGLAIPAYLTLPPGKAPKNLPVVIFPHGGPGDRDAIGFDWWAAFMANRGYAVLQPNFRGSTGYGEKFQNAGQHEWGLKMQDDITDGVKKLIADGIADPKRICIVGASYGGYAALAGATFTPDLYACAISVAGVSDLRAMILYDRRRSDNDAALNSDLEALLGSTDDDSDRLRATSPAEHADQVKCPILLLHGENDTTVEIGQSEREEAALKSAGKSVKFVRLEGDDHYLKLGTTRIQMLQEIETFLAANIGN